MKLETIKLTSVGEGLNRPESVLTTSRGEVFVSDHSAGVFLLGSGKRELRGAPEGFLPNGICLRKERDFLVANLGAASGGGVWRIDPEWNLTPWLMEVDQEPLTITNFVGLDAKGRIWISMSTRSVPREAAFNCHTESGFIAVVDARGARIAADGIGFTNECRVDPTGSWLYVNETFGRRLSRFPLSEQGELGAKEVVYRFSDGDFPDGLAFDALGGVWVACVVSNRVVRIDPSGTYQVIVGDPDASLIAQVEARYAQGVLGRADVDAGGKRGLGNVSSIAFGGKDLGTVYLGCLAGSSIAAFRSPIPGAEPPYWRF
jgi:hypothetical protein